jgi:hypothetical protein
MLRDKMKIEAENNKYKKILDSTGKNYTFQGSRAL